MALLNRQTLRNYFKKGSIPTAEQFSDLIDSTLNIVDDGIDRSGDNGFRISPVGYSKRLMSFYPNLRDRDPEWYFSLDQDELPGFSVRDADNAPRLVLRSGSGVGIGIANPEHELDVDGTVAMHRRLGSLRQGTVPGDAKWHDIIPDLDKPCAFEVVTRIDGRQGSGKYAIAHAIAVNTYGGSLSFGSIRRTAAHYGSFFNRLRFRWHGELYRYALQVRTASHYGIDERTGEPFPIRYRVTGLID
jgi:hypothetical protein